LDTVHFGVREDAMEPVKSRIRSPLKRVQGFVGVVAAETLEQDLLLVAFARAPGIAEEKQIRRRAQKDSAVPNFDTAGQVPADGQVFALRPDRDFVGLARPLGVFQDLDAVARLFSLGSTAWILKALYHPQTAALVDGKRDWIDNVRLG